MNKKTLLGIHADIQEIADVGITFYDNTTGNYLLPEDEEQACRRAQKIVKAISDEPDPEPPKEPINWLKLREEEEYRNLTLVIVGDPGWNCKEMVARLDEKSSWLSRVGYADQSRLIALYRGALALVFPSLYEGFGLPAVEAMALLCI